MNLEDLRYELRSVLLALAEAESQVAVLTERRDMLETLIYELEAEEDES